MRHSEVGDVSVFVTVPRFRFLHPVWTLSWSDDLNLCWSWCGLWCGLWTGHEDSEPGCKDSEGWTVCLQLQGETFVRCWDFIHTDLILSSRSTKSVTNINQEQMFQPCTNSQEPCWAPGGVLYLLNWVLSLWGSQKRCTIFRKQYRNKPKYCLFTVFFF